MHSHSTNFSNDQGHKGSHLNSAREIHLACQAMKVWQHLALSQVKHCYLHSHKFLKKHQAFQQKNLYHRIYVTYNRNPKSILYFSNNQNHNRKKTHNSAKIRPILRLFIQFWFLKTLWLIVSKLLSKRALFNCTRTFHMPALVAAETFTRKFLRSFSRNKQRCLWLSVTRVTAIFQFLRVRKIFESLF